MKSLVVLFGISALLLQGQPAGIWQGYDGEWGHVSSQLIALAEATPPEKFAWRPAQEFGPPAKCTCTSHSRTFSC